MSEKKKNTTQNEEKYFGKRGSIQENATKTEKIIGYVLVGVAVLAILLIIIITLLTGSEKNKIAKRFDSLTKENVFTYVTYEKLQEKVQNGEEFEVVLVDDRNSNTNYFVYCVDLIVKQYQNDENYDSDEVIYLLITNNLKDDERKYFTNIDKRLLDEPIIIHYKTILKAQSVDLDKSNNYRIDEYGNNIYALLQKYFENNFLSKNKTEGNENSPE